MWWRMRIVYVPFRVCRLYVEKKTNSALKVDLEIYVV